ncbi:MAG: NDP-sugar synthase [Deltaproteobacteria bacterium]|nr:NDP-sugar synthase [Deltaproteobacteria bacterium]
MSTGGRPRRAMVLAAGLGTRLRPLTDRYPKPAVPVAGVPPICWTLASLAAGGIEEVVVNTHWLPHEVEAALAGLERPAVSFSHEPEILGTGGGLMKVAGRFRDEPFVLANGKLVFDLDLAGAVAAHRASGATATMVLRPHPPDSPYASIEIDAGGRIRRFAGRWEDAPEHLGGLTGHVFTGVHVLEPEILEHLPPTGVSCINGDGYQSLLSSGGHAHGVLQADAYWAEPSTPGRYLRCVADVLGGRVDLTRFTAGGLVPFAGAEEVEPGIWIHPEATVDPGAELQGPVFVGPGAEVERGAKIGPEVAIEARARIRSGAKVRRSVVWQEVTIAGDEVLDHVIAVEGDLRIDAR